MQPMLHERERGEYPTGTRGSMKRFEAAKTAYPYLEPIATTCCLSHRYLMESRFDAHKNTRPWRPTMRYNQRTTLKTTGLLLHYIQMNAASAAAQLGRQKPVALNCVPTGNKTQMPASTLKRLSRSRQGADRPVSPTEHRTPAVPADMSVARLQEPKVQLTTQRWPSKTLFCLSIRAMNIARPGRSFAELSG